MFRTTAILILVVGLLGGAMWRRLEMREARPPEPSGHVLFGWDTSTSYPRDCAQIVERGVSAAIEAVPVGKDSTFSFIVTGGGATSSHEPRLVLPGIGMPRGEQRGVMRVRRGEVSRTAFFDEVRAACEGLNDENSTSIVRTIEVGLAHLLPRCPQAGLCLFVIGTDLGETVNREVAAYLRGAAKGTSLPKLDPGPVRLVVCGYAASAGGGGPVEAGHFLLTRFRALFTADIELRPYCDGQLQLARR